MADMTPLGELLERAREGLAMSKREAARRAGISEGRWRQIVSGEQKVSGGQSLPVNPRPSTVMAMAEAVGVDRRTALEAAGFDPRTMAALTESSGELPVVRGSVESLIAEIYADERIPDERKQDMVRRIRLAEAERRAVQDELNEHRRRAS